MENRIKDCQLDLFGYRASAHAFKTNQTRLILAGFAYVLMTQLRLMALQATDLAQGRPPYHPAEAAENRCPGGHLGTADPDFHARRLPCPAHLLHRLARPGLTLTPSASSERKLTA
nr:transposase [Niveispirillum irakense]